MQARTGSLAAASPVPGPRLAEIRESRPCRPARSPRNEAFSCRPDAHAQDRLLALQDMGREVRSQSALHSSQAVLTDESKHQSGWPCNAPKTGLRSSVREEPSGRSTLESRGLAARGPPTSKKCSFRLSAADPLLPSESLEFFIRSRIDVVPFFHIRDIHLHAPEINRARIQELNEQL